MKRTALLVLLLAGATVTGTGRAIITLSIWFAEAIELGIEDLS